MRWDEQTASDTFPTTFLLLWFLNSRHHIVTLAQDQQQSRCERQVESNTTSLLSLPINSPAFTRKIAARWVTDPARNGKFLQKGAARSNRFLLRVRAKKCYPHPTCPSQKYSFLWMKTCPKIHVSEKCCSGSKQGGAKPAGHNSLEQPSRGRAQQSTRLTPKFTLQHTRLSPAGCHTTSRHWGRDFAWLKQPRASDVRQIASDTQGRPRSMCLPARALCV